MAFRVSADEMNADTRRDRARPVMEDDAFGVDVPDQGADVVDHDAALEPLPMRIASGDAADLFVLDVEPGVRELVEIADMVPMHMGYNNVTKVVRFGEDYPDIANQLI